MSTYIQWFTTFVLLFTIEMLCEFATISEVKSLQV